MLEVYFSITVLHRRGLNLIHGLYTNFMRSLHPHTSKNFQASSSNQKGNQMKLTPSLGSLLKHVILTSDIVEVMMTEYCYTKDPVLTHELRISEYILFA
jgi:hypothetical protein